MGSLTLAQVGPLVLTGMGEHKAQSCDIACYQRSRNTLARFENCLSFENVAEYWFQEIASMPRHYLLLTVVAFGSSLVLAQGTGRITGTVLDEQDQLVTDAKVCLMVKSGNNTSITCNLARTDSSGEFEIKNVKLGTYHVFAANEGEGYSIENQSPGEEVVLTSENVAPQITVRLRPRGGVLLGSVTDKFTGQPVKDAWVSYQDIDGKASGSSFIPGDDGRIRLPLPLDCDLVIIVSAKGYRGWVYTDPANPARPVLRLHSGDRKTFDVQLEPAR